MAPHVAVVHSILFMLTTRRSIPGMVAVAFALTASSPREIRAQDSSRADWRAWAVAIDSVAACRRLPLRLHALGPWGEYTVHRDSVTGRTCQAGPGPYYPHAMIHNGKLACPDSNPARWGSLNPDGVPDMSPDRILELRPTQDSAEIARLRCPIRPRTLWYLRTKTDTTASAPLNGRLNWRRVRERAENFASLSHSPSHFARRIRLQCHADSR